MMTYNSKVVLTNSVPCCELYFNVNICYLLTSLSFREYLLFVDIPIFS